MPVQQGNGKVCLLNSTFNRSQVFDLYLSIGFDRLDHVVVLHERHSKSILARFFPPTLKVLLTAVTSIDCRWWQFPAARRLILATTNNLRKISWRGYPCLSPPGMSIVAGAETESAIRLCCLNMRSTN